MQNPELVRRSCAMELALAIILIPATLWFVAPRAADGNPLWTAILLILVGLAALWILWLSPRVIHRVPHAFRGVGPWNTFFLHTEELGRSARNFGAITLLGLVVLVGIRLAGLPGTLPVLTWKVVVLRLGSYILCALVQALLFFEFLQSRIRAVFGDRVAVWGTALVFCLSHSPNVPLLGLGLAAGCFWAREYLYRPNLVLLVLSHAILGSAMVLFAGIIPRVGPFYLHPERYLLRTLLPWWQHLVGNAW